MFAEDEGVPLVRSEFRERQLRREMVAHGYGQSVKRCLKPRWAINEELVFSQKSPCGFANRWPSWVGDSHECMEKKASLEGWYA
jgi:hypothetical protein